MSDEILLDAIWEAKVLGLLKQLCEKNSSTQARNRLRNIYSQTTNACKTTESIFLNEFNTQLDADQSERLTQLILAFLKKSTYRKHIPEKEKQILLLKQHYRCAICGNKIDISAHADHIVPFKYVGDVLQNNIQMLCSNCNLKKNASIDFQIRHYLGLVK